MTAKVRSRTLSNPIVLAALGLAFIFHGALLVSGTYKRTYDAYVHIFFADHYARHWFDTWEFRWYTGFTVTSYPPGAQQSIALLSKFVGLLNGFVIVQLLSVLLLVVGVHRFSRLWVSEEAAGYAALLTVFSSSIAETIHVFGQLPTIFALGFLLNALPALKEWLDTGRWRWLIAALLCFSATTAAHHVTTLFGSVFFAGPVVVDFLVRSYRGTFDPALAEVRIHRRLWRRLRSIWRDLARVAVFGAGLGFSLIMVVLPYWLWSASDPINQITIPHASRDSYIANPTAGVVFWLAPWGLGLLVLPFAFYQGFRSKRWPLAASLFMLTLLGTGGTTPLPKLLLGPAYSILTLDRFTFWATIAILPFAGEFVVSMRRGGLARFLRVQFGARAWRAIQAALALGFLAFTVLVANMTVIRQFQPAAVDMQPIVTFLSKDQHSDWRYLTLGFGDQMAWLAAQTTALTVDGDYHSARRLPELTSTPIERLEGAKYSGVPGIGSLQEILAVPEKYNLKYVFSNDEFYDPLLFFSGWQQIGRLDNGIMVWQREDIPPLPAVLPRKDIPTYQRAMWGIVPMAAILMAIFSLTAPLWWPLVRRFGWWLRPAWTNRRWRFLDRLPRLANPLRARGASAAEVTRELSPPPMKQPRAIPRWRARVTRISAPAKQSRKLGAIGLVCLVCLVIVVSSGLFIAIERPSSSPTSVVHSYFDDLDFRRFEAAYQRLDPETRPTYDQFVLNLSVEGGLLASYAELYSVHSTVTHREADFATVQADVTWITSLSYHSATQDLTMVKRGGSWYIKPDDATAVVPPDEFFSQPGVNYDQLGRRAVTSDPNDTADILDRPELSVLSARMVVHAGLHSVVGEVLNTDVVPADLTVTALVFDKAGNILTEYNAQTVAIHALLPKEATPFRIDFEGVAGTAAGGVRQAIDFQPGQYYPVDQSIWDRAASFQVYAMAVVSGVNLARGVAAQNLAVTTDSNGVVHLTGELHNTGTTEAVIPHLLLTYYDAEQHVAWVDEVFLDNSIRPERSLAFDVTLTNAADVTIIFPTGDLFANSLKSEMTSAPSWSDPFPLPASTGFTSLRVSVNYLTSNGGAG